jgi:hypothetical protein
MTTLPLKTGGTTVTVLHEQEDTNGDKTWVDGATINGCLEFPSFSNSGRVTWRSERQTSGSDVVTDSRTAYLPYDAVVGPVDRLLLHPVGDDLATDATHLDAAYRREHSYDILGEPMYWKNQLTGWAPVCECALVRIS